MRLLSFLSVALVFSVPFLMFGAVDASEIRIGFTEDATTLDPGNHRRRETETIIRNLYDGLLTRSARMEVLPELAESWKQIDLLTYEFKLHKGVKFHDGTDLTAEDVKFTFDRLSREGGMNGETSPRQSLLPSVLSLDVSDRYTIVVRLKNAWPHLPAMLPLQQIVSKGFVEDKSLEELKFTVNGTGPFKLVEWTPGDKIVMQRFEEYYGGSRSLPPVGKACVDRVVFKIIPDNEERVAALLAGEVDIINRLPIDAIGQVKASKATRVVKVVGTRTFFIHLNNHKAPFNDIRVRKALNHAVNTQQIIKDLLSGNAYPVNGVLGPDAFSFNRNLPAYEFDPAKARLLLAEAGYPSGFEIEFDSMESHASIANSIVSMLAEIGIRAKVNLSPYQELKQKWGTKDEAAGDMWLTSWGNSSLDPVGIFVPTLHSGGRGNFSRYSNLDVDHMLDAAEAEVNRARRAELYQSAQAIVNEEAPWVFLWVPEDLYGVSKRVNGWRPSPDSRINLHDVCVD